MNRSLNIRLVSFADAPAVAAIYRPYVTDSSVSFELVPPTEAVMAGRMAKVLERLPWLVCEEEGAVVGYAYAGKYRERAAYQWSVETSVYLRQDWHRRGLGSALYTGLFGLPVQQGYYTVYAGISLPNAASVRLHESFGFEPVGVYRNVGFKFGPWRDVGWWQKPLRPYTAPISSPSAAISHA